MSEKELTTWKVVESTTPLPFMGVSGRLGLSRHVLAGRTKNTADTAEPLSVSTGTGCLCSRLSNRISRSKRESRDRFSLQQAISRSMSSLSPQRNAALSASSFQATSRSKGAEFYCVFGHPAIHLGEFKQMLACLSLLRGML